MAGIKKVKHFCVPKSSNEESKLWKESVPTLSVYNNKMSDLFDKTNLCVMWSWSGISLMILTT